MKNFIVNFDGEKRIAFTSRDSAQEFILSVAEENIYKAFCFTTNKCGAYIGAYFENEKRNMKRTSKYRKPFKTLSGYQLWRNSLEEIIEVEVFD